MSDAKIIRNLVIRATSAHQALVEDHPPEDDFDDDQAAEVRALMTTTPWGWCCVKTTAIYEGFQASVYLGGCSYASADAFLAENNETQTYEACAQLLADMRSLVERGKQAAAALRGLRVTRQRGAS
jgi:hypothetical protein